MLRHRAEEGPQATRPASPGGRHRGDAGDQLGRAPEQQRVRSFSAINAWASVLLSVIAGLVAFLGILGPSLVPLRFEPQPTPTQPPLLVCPTGESLLPDGDGGDAADIDAMVQGTVSKWDMPFLVTVAASVTRAIALRRIQGTPTPFAVPVVLNILKLPTGALTAVLGLLLMRGGFVPCLTALDNTPQVFAWAVILGGQPRTKAGFRPRPQRPRRGLTRGYMTARAGPTRDTRRLVTAGGLQ